MTTDLSSRAYRVVRKFRTTALRSPHPRPPSAGSCPMLSRAGHFFQTMAVMEMCEIRFELPAADVSVLDGYCSATGKSRTDIMRAILKRTGRRRNCTEPL